MSFQFWCILCFLHGCAFYVLWCVMLVRVRGYICACLIFFLQDALFVCSWCTEWCSILYWWHVHLWSWSSKVGALLVVLSVLAERRSQHTTSISSIRLTFFLSYSFIFMPVTVLFWSSSSTLFFIFNKTFHAKSFLFLNPARAWIEVRHQLRSHREPKVYSDRTLQYSSTDIGSTSLFFFVTFF